jgi:hypothetical protein
MSVDIIPDKNQIFFSRFSSGVILSTEADTFPDPNHHESIKIDSSRLRNNSEVSIKIDSSRLRNNSEVSIKANSTQLKLNSEILNSDSSEDLSMEEPEIDILNKNLEETIKLSSIEIAQAYREKHTIRKWADNSSEVYPILSTTTEVLGEYGAGLELYFLFVKQLGYLFLFLSLLSVLSIYNNNNGGGLPTGASKQWWDYWTVANQKQIKSSSLSEAESELASIAQNKITLAITDFIGALCFVLFLIRYNYLSSKTVEENFKNNVTAGDYAVEIKGIPDTWTDVETLKEYFEQFGEVIEVYLAKKYSGMLSDYKTRAKLSKQLGYQRILASLGYQNSKKIQKLEKKIEGFDVKMNNRFKKGHITHENLPTDRAYLIFNKLTNKKTCLENSRHTKRCCKNKIIPFDHFFQGKVKLKVKQTTEPSNILWENLETSKLNRRLRKSVSLLLALVILILSVVIIYLMKTYEKVLPSDDYCLNSKKINSSLSLAEAEAAYATDDESYCYCKYQSWSSIFGNAELRSYCSYFITKTTTNLLIKFSSSCGIFFINLVLKFAFKRLSEFERASTKTKEHLNVMLKVFIATFINTALIFLLINANFSRVPAVYYIPYTDSIFTGKYADFTRDWYLDIGESLVFTMATFIISPHVLTLLLVYPTYICRRRCWHKSYKIQSDLNEIFCGPEFDLATRNSLVLNLIFTCYLYSSSIPFLNFIAAVALFFLYWTDKFLVLRHYRKPPLLSYHLNNYAIKCLPVLIILHCLFGIYMFGSENVFPSALIEINGSVVIVENGIFDRVFSVPGALGFVIIGLTVFMSLSLFCYSQVFTLCKKNIVRVEEETANSQGNYREELEVIKKHGLHTYKIVENPEYQELIVSLNSAAKSIQTIRASFMERRGSLVNNFINI